MIKKFKDLSPGLFRASNMICFTKLAEEVKGAEHTYNAVMITNGRLYAVDDDVEVEDMHGV